MVGNFLMFKRWGHHAARWQRLWWWWCRRHSMNACFIKFLKETLAALGNLPLQEASQVADLVDDQDEEPFSDEGCRREVKARCLDPTPWMLLVDVIRISLSLSLYNVARGRSGICSYRPFSQVAHAWDWWKHFCPSTYSNRIRVHAKRYSKYVLTVSEPGKLSDHL